MKDIVITVNRQKREIVYILSSILLAVGVNIYAIISYGTSFSELYTEWFTVLVLAVAIYLFITFFRVAYWLIWGRRKMSKQ